MTSIFSLPNGEVGIVTSSKRLIGSIKNARNKYPDKITVLENGKNCTIYNVPERWIKVAAPHRLSDAERARRREHAKEIRRLKKDKKSKGGTMT